MIVQRDGWFALTNTFAPAYRHIMRTIYRAENIIDANLVRGTLEQAGVIAFVAGEYLTGAAGQLPAFGLVEVMVADSDWEAAEPIVRGIEETLRESRAVAADDDLGFVAV